jgi:hypothetical protein
MVRIDLPFQEWRLGAWRGQRAAERPSEQVPGGTDDVGSSSQSPVGSVELGE